MDTTHDLKKRDERGATAVEYALMVTLIALAIIVAVSLLGTNLAASFQDDCNRIFGGC